MNKFVVYNGNGPQLIRNALLKRGNWEEISEDAKDMMNIAQFIWKPTNLSVVGYTKLDQAIRERSKEFIQVINHFENIRGICTKTGLIRSLKQYYLQNEQARKAKYNVWDSTATSFIITAGVEDSEYYAFITRFNDLAKQNYSKEALAPKHCTENIWLIKPANMNQGRGIEVFRNLKELLHFLNTRPMNTFWVAQKYIEKPLLYYGRKFDIRMWAIFTVHNEVFVYKKGYMRTSSFEYDMKNPNNYVHLTNNCLQKHGDNYGKHEEGNTLGFEVLEKFIQETYPAHNINFEKHVYQRMKDLIIDTYLCWKKNLNPNKRKYCFELFGYDFLIDEDLRTWLIEINTNPYLGIPNDYISDLLPKMLDDMLDITLDPLIPPKNDVRNSRQNNYELIYCENGSVYHPEGPFNDRSPFIKSVYPVPELIPEFSKTQKYAKDKFDKEEIKENNDENDQDSPIIKNRSSSVHEENEKGANPSKSNIESIYSNLYNNLYVKNCVDSLYVQTQISRIFSGLNNWELLSEKQAKVVCKALKLIANSQVNFLLAEQKNLIDMSKLITSQNTSLDIQLTVLESIMQVSKDVAMKKKILGNKILQDLMTICLLSCSEKTLQNHDPSLRNAAIKLLWNLSGIDSRKTYIPGETRELEKIRKIFIAQGGMIAIMILAEKSLDEKVQSIAQKEIMTLFNLTDWENQITVLDLIKNSIEAKDTTTIFDNKETIINDGDTQQATTGENTPINTNDFIFYQSGNFLEFRAGDKNSTSKEKSEGMISLPKILFSVLSFEEINEKVRFAFKNLKDSLIKQEIEEKEKRQMYELKKQKKDIQMKQELEEKRKQAFESFEARYKENQRRQLEEKAKKQKEYEELKQKEIEERKRYEEKIKQKVAEARNRKVRDEGRSKSPPENEQSQGLPSIRNKNHIYVDQKSQTYKLSKIKSDNESSGRDSSGEARDKITGLNERGREKRTKLPSITKNKLFATTKDRGYHSEERVIFNSMSAIKNEANESEDEGTKIKNPTVNTSKKKEKWKKQLSKESLNMPYPYLQPLSMTWNLGEKKEKQNKWKK